MISRNKLEICAGIFGWYKAGGTQLAFKRQGTGIGPFFYHGQNIYYNKLAFVLQFFKCIPSNLRVGKIKQNGVSYFI